MPRKPIKPDQDVIGDGAEGGDGRGVEKTDNQRKPVAGTPAARELKAFVKRIESVNNDIDERVEDRKMIYREAKGRGFNTKVLRKIIAERRKDPDKLAEEEAVADLFRHALGMIQD